MLNFTAQYVANNLSGVIEDTRATRFRILEASSSAVKELMDMLNCEYPVARIKNPFVCRTWKRQVLAI